jgi:serine/threonine protein kinase
MGEVYRARDTRLDRTVAVKVLPTELAADPQLKARFEREARAISALAHPNICTLHDIGEEDGQLFLVMEHLGGQTLAERLKKGPLPLPQALEVATQIADALAAAHRQDIVHRDLKPSNVMLTKTGAQLLDFGLARLTAHGEQPAMGAQSTAPTEQAPLTGEGRIVGTLPYMAPEQVEGKPADARTDLWALGTILYEMVTGGRAFEGTTPPSLIAAILEREPAPLTERQPLTPPALERLVRRCLAKDPDERWDTALDVAVRLREIAEVDQEVEARLRAPGTPRWVIPLLLGAVVAALFAGASANHLLRRPPEAPVVRSHIDLTPQRALRSTMEFFPSETTELALSPDGTLLVWSGGPEGDPERSALFLRRMNTGEADRMPGTEGAHAPFFSPDGAWIGFFSEGRLRKVSVDGRRAVDLAEVSGARGATWAPDGRIFLTVGRALGWVPAEGGPPQELTTVDPSRESLHSFPTLLPGGETLLFTAVPLLDPGRVEALSLASGTRKVLAEDGADACYLPTGHLVFVRQGVLMAAPFDPHRLELTAPPVPVVEDVLQAANRVRDSGSGVAQLASSESGLLVYASGGVFDDPPVELFLVDEGGHAVPLPGFDRPLASPQMRFSPDGRRLASIDRGPTGLLWLFDVDRHTFSLLSHDGHASSPSWSSDGTRLVFAWSKVGGYDLWTMPVEGEGDWERLTEGAATDFAPSWSPDGRFVAFVREVRQSLDIYLYSFGDRQVVPFLATKAHEIHPEISPDGRWLAYRSDESGRPEIYVTSFPDRKQTLTVSRQGGTAPAWSRDGRRLFYTSLWSPEGRSMMAVAAGGGATLGLGQPTALFRLPDRFLALRPMRGYDLHPDGRRFVVGVFGEQEPSPPITRLNLVHNWFAELERLAPTGR